MTGVIVTLRGRRLDAYADRGRCMVVIRDAQSLHIVAEYIVAHTTDPQEAIRHVITRYGRDVLGQVPGYLSERDDISEVERQWQ